jgi:Tyrosine phosphatase family
LPLYSREINFDKIINCRDLGGYRVRGNRTVAWRRLFRSGYIHPMPRGYLETNGADKSLFERLEKALLI